VNLNGTFAFNGPRNIVWDLLQDPGVLAKVLPGAKTLSQTAPDQYVGTMKVSVGPVTAAEFTVNVTLTDKVPPERFRMEVEGKGPAGFTKGLADIELLDQAEGGTLMQYASDVQVGGRVAAVGQRLLESVARMMMKQALDALNKELVARLDAGA
jgi:uncharacterized protein